MSHAEYEPPWGARLRNRELYRLFDQLFPHGLAGPEVRAEIAPEGWKNSPLLAFFHPSAVVGT